MAHRDLGAAERADEFATVSLDAATRQGRARRAALSHAARAVSLLQRDEVDGAASKALNVVDLAGRITSNRVSHAIHDLHRRFRGHERVAEVAEFVERARTTAA